MAQKPKPKKALKTITQKTNLEQGELVGRELATKFKNSETVVGLKKILRLPFVKWGVMPVVLYWVVFYLMMPSFWSHFSDAFFLDSGDGFQNVWNIWWVNHALTELGQNPYYTNFLHFPHGTQLVTQTMSIFNGLVGTLLQSLGMSLVQAVNWAVVFSFVAAGVTMSWFVYYLSRSYVIALFGGFLFAFSSYHFAHAIGHLQLVSLEWIPLFLLAFWALMDKWRYWLAFAAAAALLLVILCDYYYFFYCVVTGGILLSYKLITKQIKVDKHKIKVFAVFAGMSVLLTGPLVFSLILVGLKPFGGPLLGSHPADTFGTDIFSPFIPGGSWYFAELTKFHWGRLPGYFAETSIYLGIVVLVSTAVALFWRKRFKLDLPKWINGWWIVLFTFAVLALGPHLRVFGKMLPVIPLPYFFAAEAFPPLQMSGMPVRMMIMVLIAGIVIAAFVLKKINLSTAKGKVIFAAVLAVAFIDLYPKPLPLTDTYKPEYISVLKNLELKEGSGIIDNAAITAEHALYGQTEHQKPMAFGYVTRTQQSVEDKSFKVFAAIEEGRHEELCSIFKIRYFATRIYYDNGFPIIYQDTKTPVHIYDVKNSENC